MDNHTFSVSIHSFFHPKHILLIANYVRGTGIDISNTMISYTKMLSVFTEHTIIGSKAEGEHQDGTSSLGSERATLEAPRYVINWNLAPQTKAPGRAKRPPSQRGWGRGSLSLLSEQCPEVAACQAPSLQLPQFHGTQEHSSPWPP